jgi:exonuclease SbcC
VKIEYLHFENLASFAGEWSIDFTDPELARTGVFLVTGDTGAGKTTLFDAICLALFGETPRLGDIKGTDNELMSKGQGSCLAEVIFSADGGRRWKASWMQRRARGKAEGKLQPFVHQYTDVTAGEGQPQPIPKNSQARDAKLKEITGMTFAQFSRSVLLAQGEFAAFLKASAAERAPVLEQITGTGIYRAISSKIYQIASARQADKDALLAKIANIPTLGPEARQAKEAELKAMAAEAKALDQEAGRASAELALLRQRRQLVRKQEEARAGLARLADEQAAFAPQEARLSAHARALGARQDWNALEAALREARAASRRADEARLALPGLEQAAREKASALKALEAEGQKLQENIEALQPQAQEAARLDAEAQAKAREVKEAKRLAADHAARVQAQRAQMATAREKLAGLEAQAAALADAQARHPADGELSQTLAGLEARLGQARDRVREASARKKAAAQAGRELAGAEASEAKGRQALALADGELAAGEAALVQASEDLSALLDGQSQRDIEAKAAFVQEARELAMGLGSASEAFGLEREAVLKARARLAVLAREASRLEGEIAGMAEPLQLAEALLASCQRAFEEARIIQSRNLVQLRQELAQGSPCPLCGSLDHPYCQGEALPVQDKAGLKQAQQQVDGLRQKQTRMEGELATTRRQAEADEAECRLLAARLASSRERLGKAGEALRAKLAACPRDLRLPEALAGLPEALAGLSGIAGDSGLAQESQVKDGQMQEGQVQDSQDLSRWLEGAGKALDALQAELAGLLGRLASAKARQDKARAARDAAAAARQRAFEALARLEQARAQAHAHAEAAGQAFADVATQAQRLARELGDEMAGLLGEGESQPAKPGQTLTEEVQRDSARISQALPDLAGLDEAFGRLAARAKAFAERAAKLAAIAREAAALSASLEAMGQALDQAEGLAAAASDALASRLAEARTLEQERLQAFPEGDPRRKLASLEQERRRLLAQSSGLRDQASATADALARGHAQSASLAQEQARREGEVQTRREAFAAVLAGLGFAGEAQWQACLLTEQEASRLEACRREHADRQARLEAVLADAAKDLAPLLAQAAPERGEEELAAFLEEAKERRSQLDQSQGRLAQELKADDDSLALTSQTRAEIAALEPELAEWTALNRLVGQSDGQKFARYAQGITLKALAQAANRQLERLSGRYRLAASRDEELEFVVLDRYRGERERSTRNLSGGESFLVSLALALGLAEFSRGQVRVQTLFLDEGFGTLDRQAMETAVAALLALPPDSGSLVGIISHVEELKERIKTSISVTPHAGGPSTLAGPGCERGSRFADFERRRKAR